MPLAQLNIAKMLQPLDSPPMKDFVAALDQINALAEQSPGFIWRLIGEEGSDINNPTGLRAFDDDTILVNLSVWESVEALHDYVYKTAHVEYVRRRKEWFGLMGQPHMVLWWVEPKHKPGLAEAKERLNYLQKHGASPKAFNFSQIFPQPSRF